MCLAPTIMVGSVKARSAVVTWDVSKELQSRNVMYIVELFEVGKNNVLIQEDSVTKKTTTLEDLKPYTMYHVEVWAKVDSLMTEKSSETFTTAEAGMTCLLFCCLFVMLIVINCYQLQVHHKM